jgi:hypothetical protein
MEKFTVLLKDGTVGTISGLRPTIGEEYVVRLQDENGNPIVKSGKVAEILEAA